MAKDRSDDTLKSRLLRGDEEEWGVVYAEIVPRAVAKVRGTFGPGRRWVSAEDAVDSACRTMYRRLSEGLLAHGLNSYDDLLNLLVAVARNKIIDQLRKSEVEGKWENAARDVVMRARDVETRESPVLRE